MPLTSCESVLKCFLKSFLQPYRYQQWLPSQPLQNVSSGTIPRRQEPPQQVLSSLPPLPGTFAGDQLPVHLLQEAQDREMVMAARKAEEDQKKADTLMIPSRSSPAGAPSTGHSSPPPPQQKQTGAKTQKKRKKAELIPGMWSLFELSPLSYLFVPKPIL